MNKNKKIMEKRKDVRQLISRPLKSQFEYFI